jgi:hypothetical protein
LSVGGNSGHGLRARLLRLCGGEPISTGCDGVTVV